MRTINFRKYDAAGNTFLVISPPREKLSRAGWGKLARKLCDPTVGVGADGLLLLGKSTKADIELDIFNADGSWAERSGNGLRAAVADCLRLNSRRKSWTVACQSEVVEARVISKTLGGFSILADVGVPKLLDSKLCSIKLSGKSLKSFRVKIGNPHVVIVSSRIPSDWREIGAKLTNSPKFPGGVNVEFAAPVSGKAVSARVFERGVGPTESSGTGAAAVTVTLTFLGKLKDAAIIKFENQQLKVKWNGPGSPVSVAGNVKLLFSGEISL